VAASGLLRTNPTNPPADGMAQGRSGFPTGRRARKPKLRCEPFGRPTWPRALDQKVGKSWHELHGLPSAPQNPHNHQIALSHPCRFVAQAVKNGARWPIWRVAGGWRQPESTDVKAGSLAACDPGPSVPSTAKWRFGPWEKRHFPPFSAPSLPIFSGFFRELGHPGANWREYDSSQRWFGTTPNRGPTRCDLEPVTTTGSWAEIGKLQRLCRGGRRV
jgi:hypothetical protein